MKGKSILYGFIIGGISAGIVTILAAPHSGKETRHYIKKNKDDILTQVLEIKLDLVNMRNSFATLSNEGKNHVLSFIQEVKVLIETWQKEVKPHQEQLRNEIEIIQKKIQELEASFITRKKLKIESEPKEESL